MPVEEIAFVDNQGQRAVESLIGTHDPTECLELIEGVKTTAKDRIGKDTLTPTATNLI